MKRSGLIVIGALAAGGLVLLTRKSKAAGALGGTRATAVRGPSGAVYPVAIGATGEGGQLNSVFSPTDQSSLLFTFVVLPDSSKSLTARSPDADPAELQAALKDFGF